MSDVNNGRPEECPIEAKNLRYYKRRGITNPERTKKINQRGGFTAIDAYSQLLEATKEFGPVGEGWGWTVEKTWWEVGCVTVLVSLWYTSKPATSEKIAQVGRFEVFGCAKTPPDRPDADAPKKALTDAITKGLSYLGFNADVFLGKFDNNKYVEWAASQAGQKKRGW